MAWQLHDRGADEGVRKSNCANHKHILRGRKGCLGGRHSVFDSMLKVFAWLDSHRRITLSQGSGLDSQRCLDTAKRHWRDHLTRLQHVAFDLHEHRVVDAAIEIRVVLVLLQLHSVKIASLVPAIVKLNEQLERSNEHPTAVPFRIRDLSTFIVYRIEADETFDGVQGDVLRAMLVALVYP